MTAKDFKAALKCWPVYENEDGEVWYISAKDFEGRCVMIAGRDMMAVAYGYGECELLYDEDSDFDRNLQELCESLENSMLDERIAACEERAAM